MVQLQMLQSYEHSSEGSEVFWFYIKEIYIYIHHLTEDFFCINLNSKRHMSLSLVSEINHLLPKCSLVQSWLTSAASENRPALTNYCCYISLCML